MNLRFRLIWTLICARFRKALTPPQDRSVLTFRVWPLDLDPSLHMNNGRYLTIMDIGRLDLLARSGLLRAVVRHKWTPIASTISIRYRRELRLFTRFRLETGLLTWDDASVVMEQLFLIDGGERDGQIAARALFKGGLYDRAAKTFVPVARLMSEIGVEAVSPVPSPEVQAFLDADGAMKQTTANTVSGT